MTRRYKNLQALAQAFRTGEMNRAHWTLILDNDDSHLTYNGPIPDGEDADDYNQKQYEYGNTLFRGNGYRDIGDAVEAAGIPWDYC